MDKTSVSRKAVEVLIAVIDGADRMVYGDTRDRKGWRQPLALGSAEARSGTAIKGTMSFRSRSRAR